MGIWGNDIISADSCLEVAMEMLTVAGIGPADYTARASARKQQDVLVTHNSPAGVPAFIGRHTRAEYIEFFDCLKTSQACHKALEEHARELLEIAGRTPQIDDCSAREQEALRAAVSAGVMSARCLHKTGNDSNGCVGNGVVILLTILLQAGVAIGDKMKSFFAQVLDTDPQARTPRCHSRRAIIKKWRAILDEYPCFGYSKEGLATQWRGEVPETDNPSGRTAIRFPSKTWAEGFDQTWATAADSEDGMVRSLTETERVREIMTIPITRHLIERTSEPPRTAFNLNGAMHFAWASKDEPEQQRFIKSEQFRNPKRQQPNSKCQCGSGKKYKKCCKAMQELSRSGGAAGGACLGGGTLSNSDKTVAGISVQTEFDRPEKLSTKAKKSAKGTLAGFDPHQCCAMCGKWQIGADSDLKLRHCGGCSVTYYCSKECQKENWPHHKQECAARK